MLAQLEARPWLVLLLVPSAPLDFIPTTQGQPLALSVQLALYLQPTARLAEIVPVGPLPTYLPVLVLPVVLAPSPPKQFRPALNVQQASTPMKHKALRAKIVQVAHSQVALVRITALSAHLVTTRTQQPRLV